MMSAILLGAGIDLVHGGDDLQTADRRGWATWAAEAASWFGKARAESALLRTVPVSCSIALAVCCRLLLAVCSVRLTDRGCLRRSSLLAT